MKIQGDDIFFFSHAIYVVSSVSERLKKAKIAEGQDLKIEYGPPLALVQRIQIAAVNTISGFVWRRDRKNVRMRFKS